MNWIESAGGPLILIPRAALGQWGGASLQTPMVGDDYERACAISDYVGKINLGNSVALVLGDTPDSTTVLETELGTALLRWRYADSEEQVLDSVRTKLKKAGTIQDLDYEVQESDHVLIDSAWSGTDFEDSLEVRLDVGAYRVCTRKHTEPRVEFLAHVFEKC